MPSLGETLVWCLLAAVIYKLWELYDGRGEKPPEDHIYYQPLDPGEYNPYTKRVVTYDDPYDPTNRYELEDETEHERRTR